MQPSRIFETVLYAEDLAAAERFYHEALGLDVIGHGELSVVFRCVAVESCWCLILARVPHRTETFLPTGRPAPGMLRSQ
jgi:catechol 2,3-dioxygenase-like lactoylglutathione lyase family enzyme